MSTESIIVIIAAILVHIVNCQLVCYNTFKTKMYCVSDIQIYMTGAEEDCIAHNLKLLRINNVNEWDIIKQLLNEHSVEPLEITIKNINCRQPLVFFTMPVHCIIDYPKFGNYPETNDDENKLYNKMCGCFAGDQGFDIITYDGKNMCLSCTFVSMPRTYICESDDNVVLDESNTSTVEFKRVDAPPFQVGLDLHLGK